jgi:hypothetical protein
MLLHLFRLSCVCCVLLVQSLIADWSPPEDISDAFNTISGQQIVVDPKGNATAVWALQDNTGKWSVQARTRPFGQTWGAVQNLDQNLSNNPFSDFTLWGPTTMAVGSEGTVVIVWQSNTGSLQSAIQTQASLGTWVQKEVYSIRTGESINVFTVGVDGSGRATAIWNLVTVSPFSHSLRTALFAEGAWGPSEIITELFSSNMTLDLSLSVSANGAATVVFSDNNSIRAVSRPVSGIWETTSTLLSQGGNNLIPSVVVDFEGNATAVWQQNNQNVISSSMTAQGGSENWSAPVVISQGTVNYAPLVAVDSYGTVTGIWTISAPTPTIVSCSKPLGESWSSSLDIIPHFPGSNISVYNHSLAVAPNGNATVVWYDATSPNNFVGASTRILGESWLMEQQISPAAVSIPSQIPRVSVDAFGNGTAIWFRPESSSVVQTSSNVLPIPPFISSIIPNRGPDQGGNTITITGGYFSGVTSVHFGNIVSPFFTATSNSTIEAVVPQAAGETTVDVSVTTLNGTSPISPDDQYTYAQPLPPSHFKGKITRRKGYHKHKYTLDSHWKPSKSSNIQLYRIYKRSNVVKTIRLNSKRKYQAHLLLKTFSKKYSITAVDTAQIESAHKKLKICK